MVEYLSRSVWNARGPKSGPGDLTVSRVQGVALHWPGMGNRRLDSQAEVASALRGWQDYHMDDRGWSDIAYQVAVDQAGRAWTLRGLHTQSGANGNNEVNEEYGAILLVVGTGEQPSPELIATTREVIRDFRAIYPHGTEIKPHSTVRVEGTGASTDCPGDAVRALIASGAFEPGKPQQEDDEMSQADVQRILDYQKACCIQIQNNTRQLLNNAVTALKQNQQTMAVAVNNFTRQTDAGSDTERRTELEAAMTAAGAKFDQVLEQINSTEAEVPPIPSAAE